MANQHLSSFRNCYMRKTLSFILTCFFQTTVKKLATVTEILNNHKNHYLEERLAQRAAVKNAAAGRQRKPHNQQPQQTPGVYPSTSL